MTTIEQARAAGYDPRCEILVNGEAYRKYGMARKRREAAVSFPQAVISGVALGFFVVGVLSVAAGVL